MASNTDRRKAKTPQGQVSGFSRRDFLKTSALVGAAATTYIAPTGCATGGKRKPDLAAGAGTEPPPVDVARVMDQHPFFPPVEGQFVDGGVGAYSNPCYLAAYEVHKCLSAWDPSETTLISLGTGRAPHTVKPGEANRWPTWGWLKPILGAFLQSADDQQVHLVTTFFDELDFRRFQVDLREPIPLDDPSQIPRLAEYGEELGKKILDDETDPVQQIRAALPPT